MRFWTRMRHCTTVRDSSEGQDFPCKMIRCQKKVRECATKIEGLLKICDALVPVICSSSKLLLDLNVYDLNVYNKHGEIEGWPSSLAIFHSL